MLLTPMIAAVAMSFSSVSVIANALQPQGNAYRVRAYTLAAVAGPSTNLVWLLRRR